MPGTDAPGCGFRRSLSAVGKGAAVGCRSRLTASAGAAGVSGFTLGFAGFVNIHWRSGRGFIVASMKQQFAHCSKLSRWSRHGWHWLGLRLVNGTAGDCPPAPYDTLYGMVRDQAGTVGIVSAFSVPRSSTSEFYRLSVR